MRQVNEVTLRSTIRGRGIDGGIEAGEIDRGKGRRETVESIGAGEKTSASTVAMTVVQKCWDFGIARGHRGSGRIDYTPVLVFR